MGVQLSFIGLKCQKFLELRPTFANWCVLAGVRVIALLAVVDLKNAGNANIDHKVAFDVDLMQQ